ncbi:MAG: hypothetical protein A2W35_21835 [Chloroflexi bacterium RBG_16_57_11]|nr:MAG: hypothetical protein A2W35_21835 [Chloroflexi bacterium RBG_16_57_11]
MLLIIALMAALIPLPVRAETHQEISSPLIGVSCNLPESNAASLIIMNNYFNSSDNYWWDHVNLTIAVQAHPSASEEQLAAIHGAIATWGAILDDCFGGLITLTDVTGTQPSEQQAADIVVHFVPTAGGGVFSGKANCGDHGCPNVIVRSDFPFGLYGDFSHFGPEFIRRVTLPEVGHALGIGHATNLNESNDLMGYGWFNAGTEPVLSDCDLDALAFVFAWALEGSEPYPPAEGPYNCSLD